MTGTVRIQAKGQITLPKKARDDLRVKAGDEVTILKNENGRWEIWTFDQLLKEAEPIMDELAAWSRKAKRGYRPKR